MTALELSLAPDPLPVCRSRRVPRVRFGQPVLTIARARSWKRFGVAVAVLLLLAGCLVSVHAAHHTYDVTYGWLALTCYLSISTVAQVLSVLPVPRLEG